MSDPAELLAEPGLERVIACFLANAGLRQQVLLAITETGIEVREDLMPALAKQAALFEGFGGVCG